MATTGATLGVLGRSWTPKANSQMKPVTDGLGLAWICSAAVAQQGLTPPLLPANAKCSAAGQRRPAHQHPSTPPGERVALSGSLQWLATVAGVLLSLRWVGGHRCCAALLAAAGKCGMSGVKDTRMDTWEGMCCVAWAGLMVSLCAVLCHSWFCGTKVWCRSVKCGFRRNSSTRHCCTEQQDRNGRMYLRGSSRAGRRHTQP
jgi:hypothetical protein